MYPWKKVMISSSMSSTQVDENKFIFHQPTWYIDSPITVFHKKEAFRAICKYIPFIVIGQVIFWTTLKETPFNASRLYLMAGKTLQSLNIPKRHKKACLSLNQWNLQVNKLNFSKLLKAFLKFTSSSDNLLFAKC